MGCDVWLVAGFLGCNGWLRFEVGSPWLYTVDSIRFWFLFFFFFKKKKKNYSNFFVGESWLINLSCLLLNLRIKFGLLRNLSLGMRIYGLIQGWVLIEIWVCLLRIFELGFDWNLCLFVENFWVGFILIEGKFFAFSCT